MANPFLGQVLGSVLGASMGRGRSGGLGGGLGGLGGMGSVGGGLGGGLGGILGGVLGGAAMGGRRGGFGGRNAMLMMLLPLAMQWVQRNGGIGQVMQRMGQRGYGRQASSWVGTGENEPLDPQAIQEVVGRDELSQLSQQLGVPEDEVADGFAEIMPEMVDHLSPDGQLPDDADRVLGEGHASLSDALSQLERQPG